MKRHGVVLRVKPERFEEYKEYHAEVWPEVLDMIKKCNIKNYSIYHKDGYLFGYFEYTGTDFNADMEKMDFQQDLEENFEIELDESGEVASPEVPAPASSPEPVKEAEPSIISMKEEMKEIVKAGTLPTGEIPVMSSNREKEITPSPLSETDILEKADFDVFHGCW